MTSPMRLKLKLTFDEALVAFVSTDRSKKDLLKSRLIEVRVSEILSSEIGKSDGGLFLRFQDGDRKSSLYLKNSVDAIKVLKPYTTETPNARSLAMKQTRSMFQPWLRNSSTVVYLACLFVVAAFGQLVHWPTADLFLRENCDSYCSGVLAGMSQSLLILVATSLLGLLVPPIMYLRAKAKLKEWSVFRIVQIESMLLFLALFTTTCVLVKNLQSPRSQRALNAYISWYKGDYVHMNRPAAK